MNKKAPFISHLHCPKTSVRIQPGQVENLPVPSGKLKKGIDRWYTLTPGVLVLDGDHFTAKKPGRGILLCRRKAYHRRAWGLYIVNVLPKPAFFRHPVMIHALGGLEETFTYCNAKEGLAQSLERGYPVIETDLILTKDKKLVCSHGWRKKTYELTGVPWPGKKKAAMTYEEFMNTKIQGRFTTVDATAVVDALESHPKLLFEFDLRTLEEKEARDTALAIADVFHGKESLFNRILIQTASPEMYHGLESVMHFPNYQYFVHKDEAAEIEPVFAFCKEKGILSLALRHDYLTDEILKKAHELGLCILVYTVDDPEEARRFLDMGVDIICSNFLPADFH